MQHRKACFISVEGSDGAGKSTQITAVENWLLKHGIKPVVTREPGGTTLGEKLRDILLHGGEMDICPDAELLMMFAARAQHYSTFILPALEAGTWVISDRFTDSSFAYQGARSISSQRIQELEQWVLGQAKPDLTLLLDVSLEVGLSRVETRGLFEPDRFELEALDYKRKVREIYLDRAKREPERFRFIDASQSVAAVTSKVEDCLTQFVAAQKDE